MFLLKMQLFEKNVFKITIFFQLLACFCWVLKNIDQTVLFGFLRELSLQRIQEFVDLLQICVSIFEYKPSENFLSDTLELRRHSNSAIEELGTMRGPKISGTLPPNCPPVRWRKNADMTISRHSTIAATNCMF